MDPFVFITVVTLVAGAGGTGLGGIVGALFRSESNRTVSLLLSFAAEAEQKSPDDVVAALLRSVPLQ